MQTIEAEYRIVTPMFIGGDQSDNPELRPPSIKGALRFWWRALQWGACLEKTASHEAALKELHRQEAELFGAAAKEERYGQGQVSLKIKTTQLKNNPNNQTPSPGQSYLLGQGLYHFRNGFLRAAIAPEQTFKVILKLHNDVDAENIINTLLIFGLLGGLGSRSRKGWGSVAIRAITHTDKAQQFKSVSIPDDKKSYKQSITKLLNALPDCLPPFSAFSRQTRIEVSATSDKAEQLLTEMGDEMQQYRSYGRQLGVEHRVNGKTAEQNFKGDHDLVLDFADGKKIQQHPKRVVFGLPHNYFYSNGTKVDVDAEKFSRRASPLIIHIHQFSSGQCIAVQCLLKAHFLPEHERIQLKKNNKTQAIVCDIDWNVITDYLERFTQREPIV